MIHPGFTYDGRFAFCCRVQWTRATSPVGWRGTTPTQVALYAPSRGLDADSFRCHACHDDHGFCWYCNGHVWVTSQCLPANNSICQAEMPREKHTGIAAPFTESSTYSSPMFIPSPSSNASAMRIYTIAFMSSRCVCQVYFGTSSKTEPRPTVARNRVQACANFAALTSEQEDMPLLYCISAVFTQQGQTNGLLPLDPDCQANP